jgi:hypothetical protein
MKNKRDIHIATGEGRVIGGDGDHTGSTPPEFSPPIFDLPGFCLVFLYFGGALFHDT